MVKKADPKPAAKQSSSHDSSSSVPQVSSSQSEQIGFHKGSLMTLSKERTELARILNIVEQLMQMHANALTELGVKLDDPAIQPASAQQSPVKPKKPPIEDIL